MKIFEKFTNTTFYSFLFLTSIYLMTFFGVEAAFQGINSSNTMGVFTGIVVFLVLMYCHFIGFRKYIISQWKNLFRIA